MSKLNQNDKFVFARRYASRLMLSYVSKSLFLLSCFLGGYYGKAWLTLDTKLVSVLVAILAMVFFGLFGLWLRSLRFLDEDASLVSRRALPSRNYDENQARRLIHLAERSALCRLVVKTQMALFSCLTLTVLFAHLLGSTYGSDYSYLSSIISALCFFAMFNALLLTMSAAINLNKWRAILGNSQT